MKASELRIGNYYNHNGEIKKVTPNIILELFENERVWIEPIPITEEWLLNFGFSEKLGNWELPNFRFHINKPMNFDGFIFCEGYSVITDKIQFIHQLQNLYFALTGEELILKQ